MRSSRCCSSSSAMGASCCCGGGSWAGGGGARAAAAAAAAARTPPRSRPYTTGAKPRTSAGVYRSLRRSVDESVESLTRRLDFATAAGDESDAEATAAALAALTRSARRERGRELERLEYERLQRDRERALEVEAVLQRGRAARERAASPLRSSSPLRSPLRAAAAAAASPLLSRRSPSPGRRGGASPGGRYYGGAGEMRTDKHLSAFTCAEACELLRELGMDAVDVNLVRMDRLSGADLLSLSEHDMYVELGLGDSRVRKLRKLQAAAALFDAIATHPGQGSVSDVEVRLWCATHGCSSYEVSKIVKLFHSLVSSPSSDAVSFYDFAVNYDWVLHTFRMYGLNVEVKA